MSEDGQSGASRRSGVLIGLPDAYYDIAPELDELPLPGEPRSDCGNCAMTAAVSGELPDSPWVFHPDARCCTYHPGLANFLVGRAVRLSATAAQLVGNRVRAGVGVKAWGILPPTGWLARYKRVAHNEFGRDLSLRCPYWAGGQYSCGIWEARPATCRTWFCKHEHGLQGGVLWSQVRSVIARAGAVIAEYCIQQLATPAPNVVTPEDIDKEAGSGRPLGDAEVQAWLDWYQQCADLVERIDTDELEPLQALVDDGLRQARDGLRTLCERPARTMPDVLIPAIRELIREPQGIRVSGYSLYDTVVAPHSLFRFLSRLDGERTWQAARDSANAETSGDRPDHEADGEAGDEAGGDQMAITDHTIAELHRISALEAPGEPDPTIIARTPWPGLEDAS